jgi:hypothetical protein
MARDKGWTLVRRDSEGKVKSDATAIMRTRLVGGESKPQIPKLTFRGQEQRLPSKPDTSIGACSTKASPSYTGSSMIGIATLHKSNAVPVFSLDEAKDISKMRR